MVTDPISNMIVQLKNAGMAKRSRVLIPASNLKRAIADKLQQVGYLKSVTSRDKQVKKFIEAELVYQAGTPKISEVKRVSRPSQRIYHRQNQVRSVRQGHGLAIYSTPKGIMTDKEAREAKVGGEILFRIW